MTQPKVSILTTVYNREKYIASCIESVLSSTYHDWEMIIVDDLSADASLSIARNFTETDGRIKVYLNTENLGDYPNRNKAASYATGKYLKYLDADDLIYPHGLEILVNTMEQFPEAALGISQEVAEDLKPYPFMMTPQETYRREFLQRGVLGLGPTGTIISRQVFEEVGGFTGTRYIGDIELWHKLSMRHPVVKIVPGLIYWRQHDDQEIKKGIEDFFYLENAFKHKREILNMDIVPLTKVEKLNGLNKLHKRFARNIMILVKQGQFAKANSILSACKVTWLQILKSAM